MKQKMSESRRSVLIFLVCAFVLVGCGKKTEAVNIEPVNSPDAEIAQSEDGKMGNASQGVVREDIQQDNGDNLAEDGGGSAAQSEDEPEIERPKVRGIFVTGAMAGTENMDHLIDLVDQTELNAMVIDIKNDEGRITYEMQTPIVEELGASKRYIRDIKTLVEKCKEKDIYLIARIVAFKDPYLAQVKPEWCIHNTDGSIFTDKSGLAWLDPYQHPVWDYLIDVSREALEVGFDEIQFDYVRFSTDAGMDNADLGADDSGEDGAEMDRRKIITEFVQYASEQIHAAGGAISADVYGVVIDSEKDQRIVGQDYKELSKYLDYISPMVYPSHYGPYNYNIPVPDAEPYRLVLTAMQSSKKVLAGISPDTVSGNSLQEEKDGKVGDEAAISENEKYSMEELAALQPEEGIKAKVRPWLQDFTATWVKGHINYGPDEIRAQIQAVYDAGYEEWILWNASNRYTEEGLLKEE